MSILRNIEKLIEWDPRKEMYVSPFWRKNVIPVARGFDPDDLQVNANGSFTVAAAGAPTNPVGFAQPFWATEARDLPFGVPFEWRSLVFADSTDGTANADFTVRLTEMGERREFMNNPVHIRTIAGTAQLPYILREPYFLPSKHKITAQFNKLAGGAVNIRMFLHGAQYYPYDPEFMRYPRNREHLVNLIQKWMNRRKYVQPYWLVPDQLNVAVLANATIDFFMKVGDEGHFEAYTIAAVSTGNFAWELIEPKTQQTIMNGQPTQTNSVGTALFPTLLPTPYLVPAGMRLRLRLTDLSAAPNTIWFCIGGRRIYAPMKDIGDVLRDTSVPTMADTPSQLVPKPLV